VESSKCIQKNELAADLEEALAKGFDVARIAKAAYNIYQEQGLELTEPMVCTLLMLMARDQSSS
jgi:triphosphoribosyl-dephospho-CoA synthetase